MVAPTRAKNIFLLINNIKKLILSYTNTIHRKQIKTKTIFNKILSFNFKFLKSCYLDPKNENVHHYPI